MYVYCPEAKLLENLKSLKTLGLCAEQYLDRDPERGDEKEPGLADSSDHTTSRRPDRGAWLEDHAVVVPRRGPRSQGWQQGEPRGRVPCL